MIRVPVEVQPRPYDVLIESGLLLRAGAVLRDVLPRRGKIFIITVPTVRKRWGKKLLDSLANAGMAAKILEMPDGEIHKKLNTVENLAQKLASLGADRNSVVIAFGGGVVGDVTGLLASLYMRGVDFIQIPTTVLAQVDAAIGGKTGVNLRAGKNLIGTFHQPLAVLIDPDVLSSLPERHFRSGLYESLKCGVIGNAELFAQFEGSKDKVLQRDPKVLEKVLAESVKLKAAVVCADERESGLRRVLNFGHTIGHALEAETRYRGFLHGEAVAWGMIAATNISLATGKVNSVIAGRITDAILGLGRLPRVSVNGSRILKALRADKKTVDGVVHFVLPVGIGKVEISNDVPERVVLGAIEEIKRLSAP
ncbi:MAG TPA: 3-dehydroquinate synthase [Terriglobales bacterium]